MWNQGDIYNALLGGLLIGTAASLFLIGNGRVMGASGIYKGILFRQKGDVLWRLIFIGGMFVGATILLFASRLKFTPLGHSIYAQVFGGLLVGIGVTLGNGCTSGHGVCGIARFSSRSIWATIVFTSSGILVATIIQLFLGGKI